MARARGRRMQRPFERQNQTKFFRVAQTWALRGLMLCVPMLLGLLGLEFVSNPNPVPAVITIAGLVLLCFFFAYVFVRRTTSRSRRPTAR